MPYATHRIVGVIELDQNGRHDSNHCCDQMSIATSDVTSSDAARRICYEVAEASAESRCPFEPTLQVNTTELVRDLDAEFASFRAAHIAC